MNLNQSNWGVYRLGDIFDIKKGKRLTAEDQTDGVTPYIGAIDSNNGVANYIGQYPIHSGNTISLSYNGSVGEAFYQPKAFWATDDVNVLYFKKTNNYAFNEHIAIFICSVLKLEKYRYCYGRKWILDSMNETLIKLPTKNNNPDWQFMESYIKSLKYKNITTKIPTPKKPIISTCKWKPFLIGDMFDIHPTKAYKNMNKQDLFDENGTTPFVVNSAENNGIGGFSSLDATEKGGIITFSDTTDGNTFFYQPSDFIGFAHVQGMYPLNRIWSKYELLFLVTILTYVNYGRYNYGRKMTRENIMNTYVHLPADNDGNPNWLLMKQYIQQFPYSDRI